MQSADDNFFWNKGGGGEGGVQLSNIIFIRV